MSFFIRFFTVLAALFVVVDGRPFLYGRVLHEKRDGSLKAWTKRQRVSPDVILPMKIGLKQQGLDRIYEKLIDVSDPDSPNYSKHWTHEDVHAAFAPHEDTVSSVRNWLVEFGISEDRVVQSENKGWLHFHATALEAEALLNAEFYELEHVSSGEWAVGCDEYDLPHQISEHIDYVTPGVKASRLHKKKEIVKRSSHSRRSSNAPRENIRHLTSSAIYGRDSFKPHSPLSNCDKVITPACIAALYGIPKSNHLVHPGNALGIFELRDIYSQEDLDLFFADQTPWIPQGTHPTLKSINDGQAPVPVEQAGSESDLDLQLAYSIVYPQELVLYQVYDLDDSVPDLANAGVQNPFLNALDSSCSFQSTFEVDGDDLDINHTYPNFAPGGYKGQRRCGIYKPTNVISISYSEGESDQPIEYKQRQCNEWAKLGLMGVSVFVASGDEGVAGFPGENPHPNGCLGKEGKVFSPGYINSCPYVTSVGATMVGPNRTVYQPESAAIGPVDNSFPPFSSGGGFANLFPVPDYQKAAIDNYFAKHNPPHPSYSFIGGFDEEKAGRGIYNRIGRGIPDVSANGLNIAAFLQGDLSTVRGTSASSPIFAGIVTRINDARLNAGKKPIGFINPALYKNPWILNDIINGSNSGCGTDGFRAVPGWDPVTGLGTPNLPKMMELFLALP